MTPVDKIAVSTSAQASAMLTQIAARMFDQVVAGGVHVRLTTEAFEAWRFIRAHAHLCGTHGILLLGTDQQNQLISSMILAHRLFHRWQPTPPPASCSCEMALNIQAAMELILLAPFEAK